ncbi:hypothetical protein [Sphingobium yanoikuyae]|uniref:Uncharacterized protein n=1 Tax=Sphingobium yanoikuyae TaxID=13690 RepID=A0A9X7YG63_SPHYA|nr:hypothetical protein [Sphingobium yanoikuyae]QNG49332.1 hypothetical protein H3V42_31045 [Sphingobium yanoikuyae]
MNGFMQSMWAVAIDPATAGSDVVGTHRAAFAFHAVDRAHVACGEFQPNASALFAILRQEDGASLFQYQAQSCLGIVTRIGAPGFEIGQHRHIDPRKARDMITRPFHQGAGGAGKLSADLQGESPFVDAWRPNRTARLPRRNATEKARPLARPGPSSSNL